MKESMEKPKNTNERKGELQSLLIPVIGVVTFLIVYFFIPELVYKLQKWMFVRKNILAIVPDRFAYISQFFILVFFVISVLTLPLTLKTVFKWWKSCYEKEGPIKQIMPAMFLILFLQISLIGLLFHSFFSVATISREGITDINGLLPRGHYKYNDVTGIKLSYFKGLYTDGLFYELVFHNGKRISLTGRSPNLTLLKLVEKKIPPNTPHKTTEKAHKMLLKFAENSRDSLLFTIVFRESLNKN